MKYTIESLIAENQSYHLEHRVTESDVDKVNDNISVIKSSRLPSQPKAGDCIRYTSKYGEYSAHAHIEYIENGKANICLSPYTPFVFIKNDKKEISCSTSGGPWKDVDTLQLLYVCEEKKPLCSSVIVELAKVALFALEQP